MHSACDPFTAGTGLRILLCAMLSCACRLQAQFSPPRPLSEPGEMTSRAVLAVDSLGNAFVAAVVDGGIRVITVGSSFSAVESLSDIRISQHDPAIEAGPRGALHVAFEREDNELGAQGREIYLASRTGTSFASALNITANRLDDRSGRLALDPQGQVLMTWVQQASGDPWVFCQERPGGPGLPIAAGDMPELAIDRQGRSHLVLRSGGSVWLCEEGPAGFGGTLEVDRPGAAPQAVDLAMDSEGRLAIALVAGGELRLLFRSGSGFGPPRVLDRGLGDDPQMDLCLGDSGSLSIIYVKDGDLFALRGDPDGPLIPQRWTETASPESSPSVRMDPAGNLHLCFIRDGVVYITNTAGVPQAEFNAGPLQGELPLRVEFSDLSSGEIRAWQWSFGDGSLSSVSHPVHIYSKAGTYAVELGVFGPGGSSRAAKPRLIEVREPSYTMEIPGLAVIAGQKDVWVPVVGWHRAAIQGFQVAGRFDPGAARLKDLTFASTVTAEYAPEFVVLSISNDEGTFSAGLIVDFESPFDGRKIREGRGQRLVHLVFDIPESAAPGESSIQLGEGIGPSALDCFYTVDGETRIPVLAAGRLRVLPPGDPPPRLFLRADTDQGGAVDLSDVIRFLQIIYLGEPFVACRDAYDMDDTGILDLSDAIFAIDFLFLGGPMLPLPFPAPGLDPTEDGLPPCVQ